MDGLDRVGPVVVLHGPAARTALELMLSAIRTRQRNGLPTAGSHIALAQALADALAVTGHTAVREPEILHDPSERITVQEAASRLGLSERQTRRLAPTLGGRKAGRQWLLDRTTVNEAAGGIQ